MGFPSPGTRPESSRRNEATVDHLAVDVPASVETFCRELTPKLVKMLTVRVGNRFLAEELAQEALARAVADWSKVSQMRNPQGWVYKTALNLSFSRFRRIQAERRAVKRMHARPVASVQLELSDAVVFRELLQSLSRRQREVVGLRFGIDLSVEDTAEILGITQGTVKTLTHRALERLRGALSDGPDG